MDSKTETGKLEHGPGRSSTVYFTVYLIFFYVFFFFFSLLLFCKITDTLNVVRTTVQPELERAREGRERDRE